MPDIAGITEDKSLAVKKIFDAKEVMPTEEWESLIEDLKGLITERVVEMREKVIQTKWEVGDRLLKETEEKITPLLKRVSEEVRISERELFRCLAFRKKFPELNKMWEELPEGKNISWHKLVNNYIDFKMPKPQAPVDEKYDDFGLIEWWCKQKPAPTILRLRDKSGHFSLIVRADKTPPENIQPIKELYKEITELYIKLKRWDEKDISRENYARMNKAIKHLLEISKGSKERVIQAIQWCHDKYIGSQIDWTLETVVKKFPEAVRLVDPMEKYLKKKGR